MQREGIVEVLTRASHSSCQCPLQNEGTILDATDGQLTIWESGGVFPGGIDEDFRRMNIASDRTGSARLTVCSEAKGMGCRCFPDFRASALSATQHQVVRFAEQYAEQIRIFGMPIRFPFQLSTLLYLADIDVDREGQLMVRQIRLPSGTDVSSVMDGHHGVVILRPIAQLVN